MFYIFFSNSCALCFNVLVKAFCQTEIILAWTFVLFVIFRELFLTSKYLYLILIATGFLRIFIMSVYLLFLNFLRQDLAVQPRLSSNSRQCSCLSLLMLKLPVCANIMVLSYLMLFCLLKWLQGFSHLIWYTLHV